MTTVETDRTSGVSSSDLYARWRVLNADLVDAYGKLRYDHPTIAAIRAERDEIARVLDTRVGKR